MGNFSGSGPLSGFDQTETTLAFEQTFQLGGKRGKRERAARARAALADAPDLSADTLARYQGLPLRAPLMIAKIKGPPLRSCLQDKPPSPGRLSRAVMVNKLQDLWSDSRNRLSKLFLKNWKK